VATTDPTDGEASDPAAALVDGYGAMSRALAERLDVPAETHWELVAAAERAGLDEEALAALRRVTRIYERTAFAPGSVPAADQRWACRVATRLGDLVG
jgi:hypothetical protein